MDRQSQSCLQQIKVFIKCESLHPVSQSVRGGVNEWVSECTMWKRNLYDPENGFGQITPERKNLSWDSVYFPLPITTWNKSFLFPSRSKPSHIQWYRARASDWCLFKLGLDFLWTTLVGDKNSREILWSESESWMTLCWPALLGESDIDRGCLMVVIL